MHPNPPYSCTLHAPQEGCTPVSVRPVPAHRLPRKEGAQRQDASLHNARARLPPALRSAAGERDVPILNQTSLALVGQTAPPQGPSFRIESLFQFECGRPLMPPHQPVCGTQPSLKRLPSPVHPGIETLQHHRLAPQGAARRREPFRTPIDARHHANPHAGRTPSRRPDGRKPAGRKHANPQAGIYGIAKPKTPEGRATQYQVPSERGGIPPPGEFQSVCGTHVDGASPGPLERHHDATHAGRRACAAQKRRCGLLG